MAMNTAYLDALCAQAAALVSHLGLVDETGTEITGGGYARLPMAWTAPSGGLIRPTTDLVFEVAAGTTVAGWRAYDDPAAGTDYGGQDVPQEDFTGAGQYTLLAAQTSIDHNAA